MPCHINETDKQRLIPVMVYNAQRGSIAGALTAAVTHGGGAQVSPNDQSAGRLPPLAATPHIFASVRLGALGACALGKSNVLSRPRGRLGPCRDSFCSARTHGRFSERISCTGKPLKGCQKKRSVLAQMRRHDRDNSGLRIEVCTTWFAIPQMVPQTRSEQAHLNEPSSSR
jgi:hypothetical protein